jgi:hypothetical protein
MSGSDAFDDRREAMSADVQRIREKKGSGLAYWRPVVGDNIIRILPSAKGMAYKFYRSVFRHFGVGPERKNVVCRQLSTKDGDDRECPVCQLVQRFNRSASAEDRQRAKDLAAKERILVSIIDVKAPEKGVQIYEMAFSVFDAIGSIFLDREYGDIDHLDTGRNIKIHRVGEGKRETRYTVMPAANVSTVDHRIMERVRDLAELVTIPSFEKVEAILRGEDPEEGADDFSEAERGSWTEGEAFVEPNGSVRESELDIPLDPERMTPTVRAEAVASLRSKLKK